MNKGFRHAGFEIYGHKWNELGSSIAQLSRLASLCASCSTRHSRKVLEVSEMKLQHKEGMPSLACTGPPPRPGPAVQLLLPEQRKALLLLAARPKQRS